MGWGFGVLSDYGRRSAAVIDGAIGKTIKSLAISTAEHDDGALVFGFADGSSIQLRDDGRSCCEHRWMHTDDDLAAFVGAKLLGARIADGPTIEEDYEVKESQFLIVETSLGEFTIVNYNEHNGYYGGFELIAEEEVIECLNSGDC